MAGHIIIFQHSAFRGHHRHIFGEERNLGHPEDTFMNDKMSSFVILEGQWKFYRHSNFSVPYDRTLGPGAYPWVGSVDIENDQVSSLKCVG